MKVKLAVIQNKSAAWADLAASDYAKKIGAIISFTEESIKSKSVDRADQESKKKFEGEAVLKKISSSDHLVLFDERGRQFNNSIEFSSALVKLLSSGKKSIVFVIGGPYGFSHELKERANELISLSNLTMNHHLARVAALEQIYRGLAIYKNLPYHND